MRLSLRLKIVGGFSLMLLLIALLGWVTLSQFNSLRDVQEEVFDDAVPGLAVVDEIVRSYTAQSAAISFSLSTSNQASFLSRYQAEVDNSRFWEERAENLFTSVEEKELLTELVDAGRSFQDLVETEVIPRAERGQRSQAFRLLGQDAAALVAEVERLGSLLRESQRQVVLQSETDVRSGTNQTIITLIVVLVAALALGLFLAVTLPRRLVGNLSRLVEAARAVGRGDLDQTLTISSRDEVGELAQRFSEMQVGLKRLQQLALQDRELEIAASIQRNLLRRPVPNIDGAHVVPLQRQANLVGGDWYDVDVAGRQLTCVVGDASGKGIGAALMATVALSALRAERGRGATPRRVVASANEALREATDPESFTTVIYAVLDLNDGNVRWMNMGHHPPFLLRAMGEGGARGDYLEGPRNRVLGWFEDPGLADTVVQMSPGDRLLLFTDGFLEAKSPSGDVFGDHRMGEAILRHAGLGSEALAEALETEVERFAAGKLDDDLTMLVVEFQGAPEPVEAPGQNPGEEAAWHSRRST